MQKNESSRSRLSNTQTDTDATEDIITPHSRVAASIMMGLGNSLRERFITIYIVHVRYMSSAVRLSSVCNVRAPYSAG